MPASSEGSADRAAAARALVAVDGGAWVRQAVARAGGGGVTRFVYGVLRNRTWCDLLLAPHVTRPHRLDPEIRALLRIGAWELAVARTPPHAVVNECVEAVRALRLASAAGLVNAVLRHVEPDTPLPADLADRYSQPRWLVEALASAVEDPRPILDAWNRDPPVTLRPVGVPSGTLAAEVGGTARDGAVDVFGGGDPFALPAVRAGRAVVQDAASIAVGAMLPVMSGDRVLDMAAAPGGKTLQLAERAYFVIAADMHATRAAGVARRTLVPAVAADGRRPPFMSGSFDAVLLDAPCSGLGTVGRHPDLRWRADPDEVPRLAEVQAGLLAGAAALVRPGGHVLYAVCTFTTAETDGVVTAVQDDRFVVEETRRIWPGPGSPCNAMYATLFRRRGGGGSPRRVA